MSEHDVTAMFHSTAMVKSYDAGVGRLGELFGLRVLEFSEMATPEIGRKGGMTWIGDGSIEICEPIVDDAPPDRFVRRTGGGMQGVALRVADFAATVAHLEAHGVPVPVQLEGFGFSAPRSTGGIQFEWSEFTVKEDPRTGVAEPPFLVEPVVPATHHAFVAAVVKDPRATARLLAELLGTRVTFVDPDAGPGSPTAGVDLGDCTLALHTFDPPSNLAVWGREHERPQASAIGLRVEDFDAARVALRDAGVGFVRDEPDRLVLVPADTADIEVVVVRELLPGDPRS
jgi:hypothetical protein